MKRVNNVLYKDTPCNFEINKNGMYSKEYAENVDMPKYTIVIPITCNLVRENQQVIVNDPVLGKMGEFIIGTVDAQKSVSGSIDCITLYVEEMKGVQQSS